MHILEAWLIYLVVVVVIWFFLYSLDVFNGLGRAGKLFLALLIGLIIIFFTMSNIIITCVDDRFWFMLLLLLAFLAPVLIGLWLLWNGGFESVKHMTLGEPKPKVDRYYECDENDCLPIKTKITNQQGKTVIYH